jgi:hypothetical protein
MYDIGIIYCFADETTCSHKKVFTELFLLESAIVSELFVPAQRSLCVRLWCGKILEIVGVYVFLVRGGRDWRNVGRNEQITEQTMKSIL